MHDPRYPHSMSRCHNIKNADIATHIKTHASVILIFLFIGLFGLTLVVVVTAVVVWWSCCVCFIGIHLNFDPTAKNRTELNWTPVCKLDRNENEGVTTNCNSETLKLK